LSDRRALTQATADALGPVRWMLTGVAILIGVFLLVPVLILLPISLTKDAFLTWPPHLFSFQWFHTFFTSEVWQHALGKSLRIAFPVAALATLIGGAAAVGLTYARRFRRTLQTLFIAPIVLPVVTYALGLYDIAEALGLRQTVLPVVVGQAILAEPLAFIIVSSGLAGRDPELPRAAASLGASAWSVLLSVELPLIRVSIVAAFLMSLAASFDEIVVAYFLSPPGEGTLPVQILQVTQETADPSVAAASIVVIAVALTVVAVVGLARASASRRRS
jgi:putative spermidine/putrescine transport system permease protein